MLPDPPPTRPSDEEAMNSNRQRAMASDLAPKTAGTTIFRVSTTSGVVAGVVCLAAFLVIHAIWIAPIWHVAVIGLIIAAGGGAVMARCCAHALHRIPVGPSSWIAVFAVTAAPLIPCIILSALLPPLLESENGEVIHPINVPWLVTGFFAYLLIPTAAVAATIGWAMVRRRSAAALFALMGLLLAIGPGHNLPLFGLFGDATSAQLTKAFVLTFLPIAISTTALVELAGLRSARRVIQHGASGGLTC